MRVDVYALEKLGLCLLMASKYTGINGQDGMQEFIQTQEAWLRLGSFAGALLLLAGVERLWPRRRFSTGLRRIAVNLFMVVFNTLVLRMTFPLLAVGAALWAQQQGWGLFNAMAWPWALEVAAAIVLLDMIIYWQHRLMHAVPLLWRLHRMHHSDLAFDVSTAVRFHPVEIMLSMGIKMGAVVVLGADPVAVILFEILLNAASLFEHANLRLTEAVDHGLRRLIVTPDMHRVHHSWYREETDSNYGFCLSIWDRLFGSYRAQPRDGHDEMTIGLREFREGEDQQFVRLLWQPIRNNVAPEPQD